MVARTSLLIAKSSGSVGWSCPETARHASQQLSGTVDNVDVAKDFANSRIKATLFSFLEDIVKIWGFDSL